jgi:hypothetical protein
MELGLQMSLIKIHKEQLIMAVLKKWFKEHLNLKVIELFKGSTIKTVADIQEQLLIFQFWAQMQQIPLSIVSQKQQKRLIRSKNSNLYGVNCKRKVCIKLGIKPINLNNALKENKLVWHLFQISTLDH